MSHVKLLGTSVAPSGGYDLIFHTPDYRGHRYPEGRIVMNSVKDMDKDSQLSESDQLQEMNAKAQGIYETWMQDIDKKHKVTVEETLEQRGSVHGDYNVQSATHDALLAVMIKQPSFMQLKPQHRQALNIIAMKISRILSGDAEHKDHWHDIAGYATLGEDACTFKDPNQQDLNF